MSSPEQSAKPAGVENPSVPAVGTVLENRYELLQLVGHGGMGAVYRVQDRTEDRTLALKLVRSKYSCGFPVVETEQPAKPFTGAHLALGLI